MEILMSRMVYTPTGEHVYVLDNLDDRLAVVIFPMDLFNAQADAAGVTMADSGAIALGPSIRTKCVWQFNLQRIE